MVDGASTRDVGSDLPRLSPIGKRWAVLVGVSAYRSASMNLSFAHRDAQALRDLLVTPAGGNFAPEHIRLLCDEEATTMAVTQAVRGFLMEAVPDDLVLLFFACHGGPDRRRPSGPLYLFTHDTDLRDVAGTAFPMDEIDNSLRRLIQARRVVIIADTCHSGGMGGGPGTRSAVSPEATNLYLEAMAAAKGGVALLTSAEAAEASEEGSQYGGGHGVFTHFLLEGMRGAADGHGSSQKDGIVSIGELFEYVREQVQRATEGRQHPAIGTTQFDRKLPMAVTGDLDVGQYLALARRLVDVGWLLDDPAPMLLAARQFGLAAELKRHLPLADAERGGALLAAGHTEDALAALNAAVAAAPDELDASAWLHLGIAHGERGRLEPAVEALTEYRRRAPGGAEDAWVAAYLAWLQRATGRLHVLLIGAGTFPDDSNISSLPGVANDITLLSDVLSSAFDVPPGEIVTYVNDDATAANIRAALATLADAVGPDDVALVYFTGHSMATAGIDEPFLITHDDHRSGPVGLSARELVEALDLPAREVVLVLDTHISPALLGLVEAQECVTVLLACGVGEVAYEKLIDGKQHGLFTAALAAELQAAGRNVTYVDLIDGVRRRVQSDPAHLGQTPQVSGPQDGRIFAGRFPHAGLWRALRRQTPRETDVPILDRAIADLDLPAARWARGRRALADADPASARAHFDRARDDQALELRDLAIDVAVAALETGDPASASVAIGEALSSLTGDPAERMQAALDALGAGQTAPPSLCLIAPMSGFNADRMYERVTQLSEALAAAFDRPASSVETLDPRHATVTAMCAAMQRHATTDDRLAVVLYAGAVQPAEGYQYRLADGWLSAQELGAITAGAGHLVPLLELQVLDDIVDRDVGQPPSFDASLGFDAAVVSLDPAATDRLIARLREVWVEHRTYGEWVDGESKAAVIPESAASLPVVDRAAWMSARRLVVRAQRWRADDAARLAGEAIDRRTAQHEEHPEGHLQRGLAYAAALRHSKALAELRTARNLYDDQSIAAIEKIRDPLSARWHLEARLSYGRAQYEHGDDLFDAVATLRLAARQSPDDPRVLLHLTKAITALVERESLVEARQYARHYLELGAPLGHGEELRRLVLAGHTEGAL